MKFISDLETKFDYKQVSIVDLIERTGVRLEKQSQLYKACCPFHLDKTPSFVVYPQSNRWKCFGNCSGQSYGDGIEFIKRRFGYNFKEARQWIEDNFDLRSFNIKSEVQVFKPEPKIVPHPWIGYWHSLLGERRTYFHSRGFLDEFIDREMWGWDGDRYILPVWEGEPGNSVCLGVRKRKPDNRNDNSPKYIGLVDMNPPTIWGRWYCRGVKTVISFAGEFDAALANQDGLSSFSLVNGIGALEDIPTNWPEIWFPDSKYMIAVFDKKEESWAGRLCHQWNLIKGSLTAKVFHWDLDSPKDYCEYRKEHSVEDFKNLMLRQGLEQGTIKGVFN